MAEADPKDAKHFLEILDQCILRGRCAENFFSILTKEDALRKKVCARILMVAILRCACCCFLFFHFPEYFQSLSSWATEPLLMVKHDMILLQLFCCSLSHVVSISVAVVENIRRGVAEYAKCWLQDSNCCTP
jgi:hypothetical protein